MIHPRQYDTFYLFANENLLIKVLTVALITHAVIQNDMIPPDPRPRSMFPLARH